MATLGEAFIEVKADLGPFTKNLRREVKREVEALERELGRSLSVSLGESGAEAGRKASNEFGQEFEESTRRRFGRRGERKPWYIAISAALASALDDGISALPMEAKAGIVAGIITALPVISAGLAGAVAAGLGIGVAGLGVLLAFQFEEVRAQATTIFGEIRNQLVTLAQPFLSATLGMLDRISAAFEDWGPQLARIFEVGANFLGPLTRGLLGAFDAVIDVIADNIDELQPFVDTAARGFQFLGASVAKAFEILIDSGEVGRQGLEDIFILVGQLIIYFASLIRVLAEVWGFFRNIAETLPFLTAFFGLWVNATDNATDKTQLYGSELHQLVPEIDGTIAATKAQEKALKDAAKAMDQARDAAFGLIDANVRYEQALDDLDEALRENGRTLDTTSQEGRDNVRQISEAFKAAQAQAELYYQQGKYNSAQARAFYEAEVRQILDIAAKRGVNVEQLRQLFEEAMKLVNLPEANDSWLNKLLNSAKNLAAALERAAYYSTQLGAHLPSSGTRPFSEFAVGGIVTGPTPAIIGEAGPEVVIPLTKPARAAELAQQSGLAAMLGLGANAPIVYVYLGNEQLEPHMVRVVERNNQAMGTAMSYGARGL